MCDYETTYYDEIEVITDKYHYLLLPKALQDYMEFSYEIQHQKDLLVKLDYCHRQLEVLSFSVDCDLKSMKRLPPFIACREWGPKIYMRLGKWKEAEDFIRECIKANAYFPNKGENELAYLEKYHKIADVILQFLNNNPGYLQKDIYKALNDSIDDISIFKNFIRWSLLIKKEPYGKTNKLYVAD